MKSFPGNIQFNKAWRPYQKRVLDEIEEHLDDNHMHIVAAPGSGKTVLGLEVMLRLNKPTLILSPTLAIRDQWIDRFVQFFCLPNQETSSFISNDIKNPQLLTVSTYQGLHSACSDTAEPEEKEEEFNDDHENETNELNKRRINKTLINVLINKLKQTGIKTIIVDEAHHLRSEWWKCLINVKNKLEHPTIVALTATPPYDVAPLEWQRYKELCGPVDSEISVPELVKENNLCPHQDYIYLSTPIQKDKEEIKEFRDNVEKFKQDIMADSNFVNALLNNTHIINDRTSIKEILSDPAFYSSVAIFLKHVNHGIPKSLMAILGIAARQLPQLDLECLEILLTGCFFAHAKEFPSEEELFREISSRLRRFGALERRKVMLRNPKEITNLLVSSISKLNSVGNIVKTENQALGADLRMVILTDFIRRADLPKTNEDLLPLKRIGVVPIFETIRRSGISNIKLGILSGSLVVIPALAKDLLFEIAASSKIKASSIKLSHLSFDNNYYLVEISSADKHSIVAILTKLFNKGGITVLVGTKSLLGEGWDAPTINSLILASFVGSYMLSNQMRGRAIRTMEGNPNKTANIWHLVCVEEGRKEASDDLDMLSRRFKAFVGVSFKEKIIKSGIERLDIGEPPFETRDIESINSRMIQKALDPVGLRQSWQESFALSVDGYGLVEEITSTKVSLPRSFVFYNTILALFWQGLFWGGFFLSEFMQGVGRISSSHDLSARNFFVLLAIGFILAAIVSLPSCLKALYLFAKHGPITSSIKQIGEALIRALIYAKLIKTPISKLNIVAESDKYGVVRCSLAGGTTYEKSLFIDALEEILGPIDNPRYLLVRKTYIGRLLRKDYHVVPQELARKKENAEYFMRMWSKYVGSTKLIYTRNIEGRLMLLKARANALSTSFQKKTDRVKVWK